MAVTSKGDAARVLAYVAVLLEDNRLVKVQILSVLDHVNRKIVWNKVKGMTDSDFVVRERECKGKAAWARTNDDYICCLHFCTWSLILCVPNKHDGAVPSLMF